MIVEDDAIDATNICRAFRKCDAASPPRVARDACEALRLLSDAGSGPWLVLLDLNLPRTAGLEFLRALRTRPEWRRLPVIVMTTGRADSQRVAAVGGSNVVGCVPKPVTMAAFVDVLRRLRGYGLVESRLAPYETASAAF